MSAAPRPARTPGYLNAAAALLLLVLVSVLALRAQSAAPPAIAEFAPQAQQIRQAPAEQTSSIGRAPGGATGATPPSPAASPSPPPSGAVYLRCVGDPPRQIEDPQSPPCVPYWQGRNGGATSRGVTNSAITIYWVYQGNPPIASDQAVASQAFEHFFNSRFELYGRQIQLLPAYGPNGDNSSMQNVAEGVIAGNPFASTEYTNQGGYAYAVELATHHVVNVTGFEANPSEAQLRTYAPYMWAYTMSADRMLANEGDWYCSVLNGRRASHAGGTLQAMQRKPAIVYDPGDKGWYTDLTPLRVELGRCGVHPMEIDDVDNTGGANAVAQMSAAGVTSVLCVCWYNNWAASYTYAAAEANWYPEWILTSEGGGDTQLMDRNGGPVPNEVANTFGLTFQPRQLAYTNDPVWWAWSQGAPGNSGTQQAGEYYQMRLLYRSLLVLLSGIQMAGPDLTPQTFSAGLQRAVFPNPDTAIKAGAVDFFGQSHSMTVDAAQWWWSNNGTSPWIAQGDTPLGAICYVEHGRRYQPTDWRTGLPDEFMSGACDSGG